MTDSRKPPGDARVIAIRGAREHNLKNIDVAIPRDELVVFTGLSGSGKSSLAFDTIYAEGQRRYVESLSAYARQFLEMMQKPDLDQIDGLSPAISIEQKTTSKNPRSTVGTVTEIYDYMRLLWARVGVPYSPATGLPIESQTVSQMVDRVLALPEGTRIYVLAPLVRGRKGEYKKELADLLKKGYQRVKIDGAFHEIAEVKPLDKKFTHDIDVVVDRLVVKGDIATRLADSLEQSLKLADGLAVVELADASASLSSTSPLEGEVGAKRREGGKRQGSAQEGTPLPNPPPQGGREQAVRGEGKKETKLAAAAAADARRLIFSEKFACPVSGFTIPEIEPRLFSFNNPFGACPECGGLGLEQHIDAELVIPDKNASLRKGAIAPWAKSSSPYYLQTLTALAKHYKFTLDTKWKDLPKKTQDAILYGSGEDEIKFVYDDGLRGYSTKKPFEGVITNLERRFHETESEWAREDLAKYFTDVPCHVCNGARLKPEALCVKIADQNIAQVAALSVRKAGDWFTDLPARLTPKQNEIAGRVLKEIRERLRFLVDVGLDYLTLARASGTLSGGESQRIRLASQIGSGLTGVLYVLDEPVDRPAPARQCPAPGNAQAAARPRQHRDRGGARRGRHPHRRPRARHRPRRRHPRRPRGGGRHGGGPDRRAQLVDRQISLRRALRAGARAAPVQQAARHQGGQRARQQSQRHRRRDPARPVHLRHRRFRRRQVDFAHRHALQRGGAQAQRRLARPRPARPHRGAGAHRQDHRHRPVADRPHAALQPGHLYRRLHADPRMVRRPARESKARGYEPGRFSFNVKGGRCEACQGDGVIKIEMHFLPDVYVTCDVCKGKRYNRETLDVTFKGKTIADVLDMTVEEALEFFKAVPRVRDVLALLHRVGLDYIHVGQQATTLSGGEAQRVKLAKELSKRATGRTLYILDEPTTGLHFHDVAKLLDVLHELTDTGNTVVVIEHNLEVIKTADWVIDLGPEGGDGGGEIVAQGTPEDIVKAKRSYTGEFLKPVLARAEKPKKRHSGGGVSASFSPHRRADARRSASYAGRRWRAAAAASRMRGRGAKPISACTNCAFPPPQPLLSCGR